MPLDLLYGLNSISCSGHIALPVKLESGNVWIFGGKNGGNELNSLRILHAWKKYIYKDPVGLLESEVKKNDALVFWWSSVQSKKADKEQDIKKKSLKNKRKI